MGNWGSFLRVKLPELEADHSAFMYCRGYECVELYLHCHIRLHGTEIIRYRDFTV
jgi:hypothetical protein